MSNTELIAELRDTASKGVSVWGDLQKEAADAIEALEAQLKNASVAAIAEAAEVDRMKAEAQLAAAQGQPEQCDHGTAWDTPCRACDDEQAQPERAPLSDAELEQEFCNIAGLETGINPAAADTKRALVWFKKGYAHGIKQGGQHD